MITNVITKGLFDGTFTKIMKQLYIDCSRKELPKEITYPQELEPYISIIYDNMKQDYILKDKNIQFPKYDLNEYDERCLCAFSGGKDSLANILILKELGYKPIMFFVKGINYKYADEYEYAKQLSKKLDIPFIDYKLIVQGKCEYPENPTKDQFILAIMLDYGLKKGITHYSFGTYNDSPTDELSSEYMLSDSSDMFDAFMEFVNSVYPEVDLPMFLNDCCHAYRTIVDYDTNLLNYTNSCMSPLRYKKSYRQRAIKKYGIELLPNRCPSCYKCCTEAIILNDFGVLSYPQDYIEHCKEVIIKFYSKYKSDDYIKSMKSDDYEWTISDYL